MWVPERGLFIVCRSQIFRWCNTSVLFLAKPFLPLRQACANNHRNPWLLWTWVSIISFRIRKRPCLVGMQQGIPRLTKASLFFSFCNFNCNLIIIIHRTQHFVLDIKSVRPLRKGFKFMLRHINSSKKITSPSRR